MPEAPGNILPEWSSDCLHFSSDGELTTHKVPPHSIFGILLRLSCYLTPWASHWAHPALWVVSLAHEKLFCNWNTTTAAPTTTITPCSFSLYIAYCCYSVTQLCPTLCKSMDYTVHEILQARILEWVAFPFSRGFSQPRDRTQVSHIAGGFLTS